MRSVHLSVQKQLLKYVRAEIRKLLGHQSKDVVNYYRTYKKELSGLIRTKEAYDILDKSKLTKICAKSSLVLLGDYHSFAQSQRTALRLLRDLLPLKKKIILGIEFVQSDQQDVLDKYLDNTLPEDEFLAEIDYLKEWGFSWLSYGSLLEFAKKNAIQVLALNSESSELKERDSAVAETLADSMRSNPDALHFVLYGDLHLARRHLPLKIQRAVKVRGLAKKKTAVLFQNIEDLYWDLAKKGLDHTAEVVKFKGNRYCIQNATPWVKLQSYIDWAESRVDSAGFLEPQSDVECAENIEQKARTLSQSLGLTEFEPPSIDLFFPSDEEKVDRILKDAAWTKLESKTLTLFLIGQLPVYFARQQQLYLPSTNLNKMNEAAARVVHLKCSHTSAIFGNPLEAPYSAIVQNVLGYFGSKILNPKRKCDLTDDLKAISREVLKKKALPQEKLIKMSAQQALKFLKKTDSIQKSISALNIEAFEKLKSKPAMSLNFPATGRSALSMLLESARDYSMILGEKLYFAFASEQIAIDDLRKLFRINLNDAERARRAWLDLLYYTKNSVVPATSKTERL